MDRRSAARAPPGRRRRRRLPWYPAGRPVRRPVAASCDDEGAGASPFGSSRHPARCHSRGPGDCARVRASGRRDPGAVSRCERKGNECGQDDGQGSRMVHGEELKQVPLLLAEFVAETLFVLARDPKGGGLSLSTSDLEFKVRWAAGLFVIDFYERGFLERTEMVTDTVEAVWRFLAFSASSSWRDRVGMEHLRTGRGTPQIPPSVEVRVEADEASLRWQESGETRHAKGLDLHTAVALGRMIPWSLADVVCAFKDPRGIPVFSQ